jgi:hypothetical protein
MNRLGRVQAPVQGNGQGGNTPRDGKPGGGDWTDFKNHWVEGDSHKKLDH